MKKINKILIITGGISNEKELSLISGRDVVSALIQENKSIKVEVLEITGDKKMILYTDPTAFLNEETGVKNKTKIKKFNSLNLSVFEKDHFDAIFLALDGKFGEDGRIQAFLDLTSIPYTGSGVMASSIGMDKSKCYEYVSSRGVNVPDYFLVYKHNYDLNKVFLKTKKTVGFPCVVKPNDSGSSIGVTVPNSKDELQKSLSEAFRHSSIAIVQKLIKGREFACGVLGNTGYTELEIMPVAESVVERFGIYTHCQKYYTNDIKDICPARIADFLRKKIMENAKLVHEILGCDGLSRSDFRYDETTKKLYFLEINTSPGHTKNSICPQEAKAIGMSFGKFILVQINLALVKKAQTIDYLAISET